MARQALCAIGSHYYIAGGYELFDCMARIGNSKMGQVIIKVMSS